MADICPVCGAPVTYDWEHRIAAIVPMRYAPPALSDLERAVVEAAIDYVKHHRLIQRMPIVETVIALNAARAQEAKT